MPEGIPHIPEDATDAPTRTLVLNEQWWSLVQGALGHYLNRYVWDSMSDAEWQHTEQQLQEIFLMAADCDCIKNLTYNSTTRNITYENHLGNTITLVEEGDIFAITQSAADYIPPWPTTSEKDIYCRAAQRLAARAADTLQDVLEFMDIVEEVTAGAITNAFKALINDVPVLGSIPEATIETGNDMVEDAYDWVKLNATDAQAISGAAEIIYCALSQELNANTDDPNLRQAIIDKAGSSLVQFSIQYAQDVVSMSLFGSVTQAAYDALDGSLLKYPIIAQLLAVDSAADALGVESPIKLMVAEAARNAQYFDARDCSGYSCGWEQVFDFTEAEHGFAPVASGKPEPLGQWQVDVGFVSEYNNDGSNEGQYCYIERDFGQVVSFNYIAVEVYHKDPTNSWEALYLYQDGNNTKTWQNSNGTQTHTNDEARTAQVLNLRTVGNPTKDSKIIKLTLRGDGVNPFL